MVALETYILPSRAPMKTAHPFEPPSINTQPTNPYQSINFLLSIAVCLTGLTTGFTNLPSLTLLNPPSPELTPQLQTLCTTALPLTLGAILTAPLLDFILQQQQQQQQQSSSSELHPHTLLVLAVSNLLIAFTSASSLLLLSPTEWESVPSTVITTTTHLLLGAVSALNLTVGTLLCEGRIVLLGGLYVAVALGGVLRAAVGVVAGFLESRIGCGFGAIAPDGGEKVVGVVLALVAAAAVAAAAASSSRREMVAAGDEEVGEAVRDEKGVVVRCLDSDSSMEGGYPPPASRTTIFGALFAFAYHAVVVIIPAWLVSSVGEPATSESALRDTTAAVWGGVVVGRCVLLPWYASIRQAKHVVSWTLTIAASLLLLSQLFLGAVKSLMAVAAVTGLLLGPVYPCVVGIVIHGLDDHEKKSGLGIVVAFGSSGTLAGAFINLLVGYWGDIPFGSYLLIAGLFGGLFLCWDGLLDEKRS